jgi:uncharacterized protein YbjT (DUF2867 family)
MILVTGAGGLSGSIVIREFARQGRPVRALVRNRAKARALETLPGVEVVEGDMLRPETLGTALDGTERVLMISTANRQMVETQCSFIDACQKAGVGHVVKLSGAEPDFDARNFLFTRMHEEIERYLERSWLAWTHLRPSQFMQVYLREVGTIVAEGTLCLPLGDIQLAPVDIEDIAKVAVSLLWHGGHEGRRYDMTGPEPLMMKEIADRISQATGRALRYVDIPLEERRRRLLAAGMPEYFVDALDDQTRERRRRSKSRVCLEAHEAFGVRPTTFAEFARRHAAMFRGETGSAAAPSAGPRAGLVSRGETESTMKDEEGTC